MIFIPAEDASNSFSSHSKIAWTWWWDWTVWISPSERDSLNSLNSLNNSLREGRTKLWVLGGFQEFLFYHVLSGLGWLDSRSWLALHPIAAEAAIGRRSARGGQKQLSSGLQWPAKIANGTSS